MSTYSKANWLMYASIIVELPLVALIVSASDWPVRIVSAAVAVSIILFLFAYPRCPHCGLNPWFRKVPQDAWYAIVDYIPLGELQKSCSRCGTDLTGENP
ncbi:MAG: hypothetical protein KDD90_01645 [Sphingomonadaceae bacterium]|jgi:ribosomal protein S27AE|nr:hypothetical protein [Sphingomonadaceae bacterium]